MAAARSTYYGRACLIHPWCYQWTDQYLIQFSHKVASLQQVWRSSLQVNGNLMTSLLVVSGRTNQDVYLETNNKGVRKVKRSYNFFTNPVSRLEQTKSSHSSSTANNIIYICKKQSNIKVFINLFCTYIYLQTDLLRGKRRRDVLPPPPQNNVYSVWVCVIVWSLDISPSDSNDWPNLY